MIDEKAILEYFIEIAAEYGCKCVYTRDGF